MNRTIHLISGSKKRLTLLSVLVLALASGIGALAYWTTSGTGSATASAGSLTAPSGVSGSASGSTVTVSWSQPAGTPAPTGYYVTRSNGSTASAACASSAASPLPATPTLCNDTNVPSAIYTYTVVAVYHSWTAASAPSESVTVAALDHFTVSAPASTTAGSAFSVTVSAKEAAGGTVGTYRGTIHFTSSDSLAGLPANYTFTSGDNGSHTFTNAVTLKTTPSQTVSVNDTVDTLKTGQAIVAVTPATASTFSVSGYPSSTVAGVSNGFTVTAKDAFGNTDSNYAGTVHFTATNDAAAVLPANTTLTSGSGSFSATFKTVAGGTKALTATDTITSSITGSQSGITVTPAAAAALSVSGYPSPTVAGVSHTFSVVAQDTFGNTATGYAGTVHFTATGDAAAVLPADSTLTAGSGSFSATFKTVAGGTKTLTATDTVTSSVTGSQTGITVTPASAVTLTVAGYPASTVAGTSNNFTVTAKDQFGNTDSNYAGTVAFSNTNDTQAVLPASSTLTAGTKSFSATFKTVAGGTKTLTATDTITASITGSQTGITVTEAAIAKLVFITAPKSTTAGVNSGAITVQRQDVFGNPISSGGFLTVNLTSSSAGGSFRDASNATITSIQIHGGDTSVDFFYTDTVAGTPTITGANGSLTSATQQETVTSAGASKLVFTTSPQTLTAGVTSGTITVQRQDQFSNPVTSGATTVNLTTSSSGVFRDTGDILNITNVTISTGSSAGSFKYNDMTAGTPTLTAAATALTSGTQTETVTAANASKLVFTTAVQTVVVGQTGGTITVQRQDVYGNPTTLPTGAITVALASSSTGGLFRNTTDTATITTIQIPSGATSADFKYKDSLAGSPTITGSSSGLDDATQAETVNKASTTTSLSSSAATPVFGQSITLTATVAAVAPGSGTPTGTVNFKDAGTTITGCGSQALSGSGPFTATCTTSALSVASHTITAVYLGDGNFLTSTSGNFTQTVSKASTTTSLVSGTNPSVSGQPVTFTATVAAVAPGAGTPTGTVAFKDGLTTICAAATLSAGTASCATSALTAAGSTHSITAVYSSDANFLASTSSALTQTVTKADTSASVVSTTGSPSVTGQPVTYTATVTATAPGSGTPTGNIEFFDAGTPIAVCGGASGNAVNGSGVATCAVTYATPGSHTITAQYLGDSNYIASAVSGSVTQTVNKASTTTSLATSLTPSVFGQSVTLTATVAAVAPGAGTPTGTVNFLDAGTTIPGCATQTLSGGQATCATAALSTGTHGTITAVYSNDANFLASTSGNFTQTVNKASTTTSLASSSNPSVVGEQVTYTATVSPVAPGAGVPTGTINFRDNGVTITACGTQTLNGGQATCSITYPAPGSHTLITAVYSSDTNFLASTSGNFTQTVNKASTTTTLATSLTPSVFGQSITLTATVAAVAPGAGTPTGTVNFLDNGVTITGCGAKTLSGGQATCPTAALSTGTHATITAVYSSDANFLTSTSGNFTQTVSKASTTTTVTSSANPTVNGQSVTFTAPVSAVAPGAGTPTGTIDFKDGVTTICAAATMTAGAATCTAALSTGSHTITAIYNGDGNFTTSNSSGLGQSVNIFAGIDFTNVTSGGINFSCTYTTITAVTCSAPNAGNGGTFSGKVRLIDGTVGHASVINTGSPITVSVSATGDGAASLAPASSPIATSASATTSAFSLTLPSGGSKSAIVTATIAVNGATYTVTLTIHA